jgi:hypothetical protein
MTADRFEGAALERALRDQDQRLAAYTHTTLGLKSNRSKISENLAQA